ncbi:MAG: M3 family oligoendopeptidase [Acholeplasmataceae bacterium]
MWNLNDLYEGFNEKYQQDIQTLKSHMEAFKSFIETKDNQDVQTFLETYLLKEEHITKLVRTLYAFASLKYSSNVNDPEPLGYMATLDNVLKSVTKENVLMTRYIANCDIESLSEQSEIIKKYAYNLNRTKASATYLLSESEETLVAKFQEVASDSWRRLQQMLTSNLKVPFRDKTITLSEVRNLAYEADPAKRKDAYEAELKALETIDDPIALAITNIKRQVNMMNGFRGYQSPLEPTLRSSKMTQATLDALIQAMESYRPAFANYLKAKAEYLGHQDGLPFYDLFAPVGHGSKTFTYEEAKQLVLDAFYGFSDRLGNFAKRAFDEEWIDVEPRKGKVGGAFCSNQPQIGQSRILTNFTGSLSDVLTLAHELGHGFHGDIIKDNDPLHWSYPMPLAETASIFCEAIVNDYLLKTIDDDALKLNVLENALQGDTQVIIDILSRFYFETNLFQEATKPVQASELKSMMLNAQDKAYQDGLHKDIKHPYMWLMKPHYYSAGLNFYNFPYAFGLLFGKGLFAMYKKDPSSFTEDYETLLAYTTKADVEDVAKTMNIDVTQQAFWDASLKMVESDLLEVIDLFKKTKDA